MGGSAEHAFRVDGDTLTLVWGPTRSRDGTVSPYSAAGGKAELTLVRER